MENFLAISGRLFPVLLSFLLLAAHFSRSGNTLLVVLSLSIPLLLLFRRPWIPILIQVILLLGAAEWIRSMINYIQYRRSIGDDYVRLAIILSFVALFTLLSGWVFRGRKLKGWYRFERT